MRYKIHNDTWSDETEQIILDYMQTKPCQRGYQKELSIKLRRPVEEVKNKIRYMRTIGQIPKRGEM